MANRRKGFRLKLSPARKIVHELMVHAKRVPSIPLARKMNVAEVAAAKEASDVSWIALYMKAFALTAKAHPVLRQAYLPYPWPHLYEHPHSECALLIEREWKGERVTLGARIFAPEDKSLVELTAAIRKFQEAPVWEINFFRQALRVGALPWPLRRFTFWQSLYLSGFKRAKRFGTFMISSLGKYGVEQRHPIIPMTVDMTIGPIRGNGEVTVTMVYDHRVTDGSSIARALRDLDKVLHGPVLAELRGTMARAA